MGNNKNQNQISQPVEEAPVAEDIPEPETNTVSVIESTSESKQDMLSSFVSSYTPEALDFSPANIKAKTEVGRTKDEKDVVVVNYAEVGTSIDLPSNLLSMLSSIGPEKAFNYLRGVVERRFVDLSRVALKTELAAAKTEEREPNTTGIVLPFTNENWASFLDEQKREGKAAKAIRAATTDERNKAIENIKNTLAIVGRDIASLSDDERGKINASCGYRVF